MWTEQFEQYRNRNIETLVAFDDDGVLRFRRVNPDRENTARWKRRAVPGVFDILGGVLFVRSQLLNDGDRLRVTGFPGDSAYVVDLTVEGRERIRVVNDERAAIRLAFRVRRVEFDGSRPERIAEWNRFRRGVVWLSDDEWRVPLRAEVALFIGRVVGELVKFRVDGAKHRGCFQVETD